ncbi:acetyl-CoA carboxylase subunit A [Nitrosophilus alvini]|uniref:acetyl-CoA carboxylase subunit A n=1 Tax=Nitrosophilus alvini TaxID=2714855 RepID=UPI00190D99D6|nr:acetyl-CoA carboxylase subunit A [Nitrosophilus alvini]
MFHKLLIANRGEIAVRIIRACNDLGIKSVAIYSKADRDSLHVKMADEAYKVSDDPLQGYLNPQKIIDIALASRAEAIHPGYGFLAENADFAKMVEEAGLTWIGPKSEVIAKMGDKNEARKLMIKNGIPVVPGTENIADVQEAIQFAQKYGYPVIVKATSGGGGRGLRVAYNEKELVEGVDACRREAMAFFKDDSVFVEKYVENPKHIEFQILADNYGNIIHLGERDCSIQRRHQKLLEIAPSPSMSDDLRKRMGAVAVAAAKAAKYTNAGTVEFLVDEEKNFYFMEMNTRIQVEHCITEEVTGVDLVVRQIRIAAGEILELDQTDINFRGFSIEARINAEDVFNDFKPNPGKITAYYPALGPNVRVDSAVFKDYTIPPHYDSMIAKLIVRGASYDLAVRKLRRALNEFTIRGVKTTIEFLKNITNDKDFKKGDFDTSYLENKIESLLPEIEKDPKDLAAAIAAAIAAKYGF